MGHEEKYYEVKDGRYLGEEPFIGRIEMEKKEPESWFYDILLEAIAQEVSRATGITEDKLHSATRGREGARGRGLVGYLARKLSGYMVKEIAEYFGRSPVAIGEAITRIEGLLRKDTSFEKVLKRIGETVVKGKKRKYRISVA